MSYKGFLPTVIDIMVIWVKFAQSSPFSFTDASNVDIHRYLLLFEHFQFALIHGPNIPGSFQYCYLQHWILFPSPVTSTTGCCFCFGSITSFFLELFLHGSPVVYWAPADVESSSSVSYLFAFSYCSEGKNIEAVCHSLLQWTTFCQNSLPWSVHFGWPYLA